MVNMDYLNTVIAGTMGVVYTLLPHDLAWRLCGCSTSTSASGTVSRLAKQAQAHKPPVSNTVCEQLEVGSGQACDAHCPLRARSDIQVSLQLMVLWTLCQWMHCALVIF
jgi:hypothetical protein